MVIAFPILLLACSAAAQQPFQLPTANRALFDPNGADKFFVGTPGKSWTSGCFGCVRSEGWQMHEGLDIRCLQRDARAEPIDPVLAAADGAVVYVNNRPSLSNYGKYVVIRHRVEGIEIYSLYAHLRDIAEGVKAGQSVKPGQAIGRVGHTSNTSPGISKERAHLHFELGLLVSDRFAAWFKKTFPKEKNDHGQWNGQNLLGLDPRLVLLAEHEQGSKFSLLNFIRSQNELCRVLVRRTDFAWPKRYPALIRPNPRAEQEGIAGYELALNFNGVPFELIPRAASEFTGKAKYKLLSVNETEYRANPCRRMVVKKGSRWELATRGINLLGLLTD